MGHIRKWAKKALSDEYYYKYFVRRKPKTEEPENSNIEGYFGLNGLDLALEKYVDFDNGFFVELGGADGITQSNSYHFELLRSWKGVLVEPYPEDFIKCLKRRGAKSKVFCAACVPFDFEDRFVEMRYKHLRTVSASLELDLPGSVEEFVGANALSFGAIARTLDDILEEASAPKEIDFLSLDVEGAEKEVLRGVDFNKYKFAFMLIECRDIDRLKAFLAPFGYSVIDKLSHHDYLFQHKG